MKVVIECLKKEKVLFRDIKDKECFYSNGVLYMKILQQDLNWFNINNVNAISIMNAGLTCFRDDEIVFTSSKIFTKVKTEMNTNLNKIQTKFGTVYIEPLNGNREESERIKIYDSDTNYIDYFPIETLEDCATEMGITLEEEYATRIKAIRGAKTVDELFGFISTEITRWTDTPLEFAALLNADGITETQIYNNIINSEFVNRIGKIYTLSRE